MPFLTALAASSAVTSAGARLGVVGNIARVSSRYPDGHGCSFLGGAALHVTMASSQAGLLAAPIAVIGDDLQFLTTDARLQPVDLSAVRHVPGRSCHFVMHYDARDSLQAVASEYGVSVDLTNHALAHLGQYEQYHISCRRPLDAALVLRALRGCTVSVDFISSSIQEVLAESPVSLTDVTTVFVNTHELAVLQETLDLTRVPKIVVSNGPDTARVLRWGEVVATATPPRVAHTGEVTGAGDTLAGTFLAAVAHGLSDTRALETAVKAATAFVATEGMLISLHT